MNFTSGLFSLIIGIIISIYMFMGKERFLAQSRKVMYALFNEENAKFMIDLASEYQMPSSAASLPARSSTRSSSESSASSACGFSRCPMWCW